MTVLNWIWAQKIVNHCREIDLTVKLSLRWSVKHRESKLLIHVKFLLKERVETERNKTPAITNTNAIEIQGTARYVRRWANIPLTEIN